jgi:hypothetical protein
MVIRVDVGCRMLWCLPKALVGVFPKALDDSQSYGYGEHVGNCEIALKDIRRGRKVKKINLEWFGPEIMMFS